VTEWIIGLDYKIRAKTTRGFKNIEKVLCHCYCRNFCGVGMVCVICEKWFDSHQLGITLKNSPQSLGQLFKLPLMEILI